MIMSHKKGRKAKQKLAVDEAALEILQTQLADIDAACKSVRSRRKKRSDDDARDGHRALDAGNHSRKGWQPSLEETANPEQIAIARQVELH